jgi:hypothetical protein
MTRFVPHGVESAAEALAAGSLRRAKDSLALRRPRRRVRAVRYEASEVTAPYSVALPVVLTVGTMPFSYSIANGIGVGFISWVVMRCSGSWLQASFFTLRAAGSSRSSACDTHRPPPASAGNGGGNCVVGVVVVGRGAGAAGASGRWKSAIGSSRITLLPKLTVKDFAVTI